MMLKARVIPCLDVKDGRVVKGVNFVDLRDAGDPVEAARAYDAAGADELCFLDITASHEERAIIFDVVRRTAEQGFMPLTVGGGVRTVEDVRQLLLAGADKVSINTAAVFNPDFVRVASAKFRSEEHTSELQSRENLVCRLLLEKKKTIKNKALRNRGIQGFSLEGGGSRQELHPQKHLILIAEKTSLWGCEIGRAIVCNHVT